MPKTPYQPTWERVADDFVIGACTRQIFGYMSLTAGGTWAAFDNDAEPVGMLTNERDAREALCASQESAHAQHCVKVRASGFRGLLQYLAARCFDGDPPGSLLALRVPGLNALPRRRRL
ncbi:hypothetical protein [Microbacterium testaceum]|uniref:hypothetical protein n=1 Tax=Microbacterium testaceum TaxID=2033 RepID=UPI0012ACCB64|nr:hypothetical protein [Microbacterium testaceum]